MDRIVLILSTLVLVLSTTVFARDPDLPPPERYGEPETVGGSRWTAGDTFIAIALPVAVVLTLALPHLFDGECLDWPVYKFKNALSGHKSRQSVQIKFPTRRL